MSVSSPPPNDEPSSNDDGSLPKHKEAFSLQTWIAGPLQAIINAQQQSAAATFKFILDMASDPDNANENFQKGSKIDLKNVEFGFKNMELNEENNVIEKKSKKLSVPLLSMLPVPYLNIAEAEVDFDFNIVDIREEQASEENKTTKSGFLKNSEIYGTLTSSSSKETRAGDLHIKIKIKQDELPSGLAKSLSVIGNSLTEEDVI